MPRSVWEAFDGPSLPLIGNREATIVHQEAIGTKLALWEQAYDPWSNPRDVIERRFRKLGRGEEDEPTLKTAQFVGITLGARAANLSLVLLEGSVHSSAFHFTEQEMEHLLRVRQEAQAGMDADDASLHILWSLTRDVERMSLDRSSDAGMCYARLIGQAIGMQEPVSVDVA
jgi:hypothetical protein